MITYGPWRSRKAPSISKGICPSTISAFWSRRAGRSSTATCLATFQSVRGGGTMHVRMLCLGRHWNGKIVLLRGGAQRLRSARCSTAAGAATRSRAGDCRDCRDVVRSRPLHPQLLQSRGSHGAASGQGRERAVPHPRACRSSPFRSATAPAFCSAGCGDAIRSMRCFSIPATRLCSAVPRVFATTGCLASSRPPRRQSSVSRGDSI